MRILFFLLFSFSFLFSEQMNLSQTILLEVGKVEEIDIELQVADLTLSSDHVSPGEAIFKSQPLEENFYSYTLIGNKPQKLKAILRTPLPKGMDIFLSAEAPKGARSLGPKKLSAQHFEDLVENIQNPSVGKKLKLSYQLQVKPPLPPQVSDTQIFFHLEEEN